MPMTPDHQPDRGERRWTIWVWPDGSYSRFNESGHHAVGEPIEVCPVADLEHLEQTIAAVREELERRIEAAQKFTDKACYREALDLLRGEGER